MEIEAKRISDEYDGFISKDEILDWIRYIQKELKEFKESEQERKEELYELVDWIIQNKKIYKLCKKSDVSIILKSKNDQIEIENGYIKKRITQLLSSLTINPITGKGHTHPDRKPGQQFGKPEFYLKQRLAHDLYVLYKRRTGRVRGVNEFIKMIFDAAGYNTTINQIKNKFIYKNILKEFPNIIYREIRDSIDK